MNMIINYSNANSRDTYFTMHHVKEAHRYGKGESIKVGIIDWCFGLKEHESLYSGSVDVSGDPFYLDSPSEHGFWMAQTLKEIAPACEIFAINYLNGNNFNDRGEYIAKAIDWAIENGMQILTFSGPLFNSAERPTIDKAVQKAVDCGIITTFIHYDFENNFFPGALMHFHPGNREPDIRILHYDYNTMFIERYRKYAAMDFADIKSGDDIPYFSMSSMSPVLAGFIAILKSIRESITLKECKALLKETSYETHFTGYAPWDNVDIAGVADIGKAAKLLSEAKVI